MTSLAVTDELAASDRAEHILAALAALDIQQALDDWPRATDIRGRSPQLEWITLAGEPYVSDGFTLTLHVDQASGYFWLSRSGGIAGFLELYGPAYLDNGGDIRLAHPAP